MEIKLHFNSKQDEELCCLIESIIRGWYRGKCITITKQGESCAISVLGGQDR